NVIRADPYQLAKDIHGVGFVTADTLAQKLGLPAQSPQRHVAGLKYVLSQATDDGHVFLPRSELLTRASEALGATPAHLGAALAHKVSVLTGGPGVGKTTTLRAVLHLLEHYGIKYCLAAPTGRAAKRMSEATGRPASTMHRLLEFSPGQNEFQYNDRNPLPYSFVIADESSMIDILLFYALLKAIPPTAHLLLVGDADQ